MGDHLTVAQMCRQFGAKLSSFFSLQISTVMPAQYLMGDNLGTADLVGGFPFFPYFLPPLLSLLTRARFDLLNLKFLSSSQIYAYFDITYKD